MKKEERTVYYDADFQIKLYEFKGITQKFNSHFHREYVIGFIEDGERNFYCNNRTSVLRAGDILLINPLDIHGCEQFGDRSLHYFSFNISCEVMKNIMVDLLNKDTLPHFRNNVVQSDGLWSLMYDFKYMVQHNHIGLEKEEVFILFLEKLINSYSEPIVFEVENDISERIEQVCDYLEKNFYRNIYLDDLCSLANVSKYYLLRSFTKIKGISPHKYLEVIRIEKAKKMLEKGVPIIDTALKTGFVDQSHFTNLFKSLIGLTPKVYQNMMKEAGADDVKRI